MKPRMKNVLTVTGGHQLMAGGPPIDPAIDHDGSGHIEAHEVVD